MSEGDGEEWRMERGGEGAPTTVPIPLLRAWFFVC
jgi:hypothetical protein